MNRRPGLVRAGGNWPSFAGLAAVGYLIYGVGAAGPYLREELRLTDSEVGLHSSALAIGLVLAGTYARGLQRWLGEVAIRAGAIAVLALGIIVLAAAPSVEATLGSAVLIGLGAGALLGYVNATLGAGGGRLARVRLARANMWAVVAGFVGSLMFAAGASIAGTWWLGLLPAFGLLILVAYDLRSGGRLADSGSGSADGRLSKAYWLTWLFLAAAVGIETAIVFWGATLVERRTHVALPQATATAALFVGGMFVGRLGLSLGLGVRDSRRSAAAGLGLAAIGAVIAWVSTAAALSGIGLFVAGLGVAVLYPLGVAASLAAAPGNLALAANRLTLASGAAILVAPLALGLITDAIGVVVGWSLLLALVVVAAGLVFAISGEPP